MEADQHMWSDLLLQAAILLLILLMFLFITNLPHCLFSNLRLRLTGILRRSHYQAKRHFVLGAQLLSQARSDSDNRHSLAERAAAEADRAIALDPRDAASHILKALALDLQGFRASAIDSLDTALSPLAAGSLSDAERADALLKRVELRLASASAANRGVADDLAESARLIGESAKGCGMLGVWYEKKGMKEEARRAYQDAIRIQPEHSPARDGLARLGYGFTVDDGPLRRLDDPRNSAFLESIRRSECPQELAPENERTAIHVNLMKKEEDYKEPVRYVHVMALCKKDKAKEGGECAQDDADIRTAGGRDVRQRLSGETPPVRGRGRGRARSRGYKGDRATRQRTDPVANTDGGGGSMPNAAVGGGVPMEDEPNITDLRTLYKLLGEHIRREVDRMRREGDLAMREEVHRIQDEFVRLSMRMHRAPVAAAPSHQTSGLTDVVHASDTAASRSPAPLVVEDEEDEDYGI